MSIQSICALPLSSFRSRSAPSFSGRRASNRIAALPAAAILGVIADAGMTVSTAIRYGQPIMPSGTLEWLENAEYVVAIALGFVAGNTFARLPGVSSWFPERADWGVAEVEAGLKK